MRQAFDHDTFRDDVLGKVNIPVRVFLSGWGGVVYFFTPHPTPPLLQGRTMGGTG